VIDHSTLVSLFLLASVALFALVFGFPLLLAPIAWARVFRWQPPAQLDLTRYFGRCLGACALGLLYVMGQGALHAELAPLALELTALAGLLLTGVHVRGALLRQQPWTEDAEILLYLAAAGAAIALRVTA
jgi:hypothetical protein